MTSKRRTRKPQPKQVTISSNKNLVGLSGIAMLILTNYQVEIKHVISALLGSMK
jgi:hypothetical protein